jgi:TetR/AcrR family transcriptional repressor of nem operon
LIQRYRYYFNKALAEIDATCADVSEKLRRYVGLYAKVLRNDRMCLCGMLAAEVATLPKTMRNELKLFFDENEIWLSAILDAGRATLKCDFAGAARDAARYMIATLEGGMILSRSYGEAARFDASAERLLVELGIRT